MIKEDVIQQIKEEADQLSADDIWAVSGYGAKAQDQVNEFSRMAMTIASGADQKVSENIMTRLSDKVTEIDKIKAAAGSLRKFHDKSSCQQNYRLILRDITDISLAMQVQQAKMIKEHSLLEEMEQQVKNCGEQLELYVRYGKVRFDDIKAERSETLDPTFSKWCDRLEKQLHNLEVSKLITEQEIGQIELLKNNQEQLIDLLNTAVSETIPLWRNQVIMEMGLDVVSTTNQLYQTMEDQVNNHAKHSTWWQRNFGRNKKNQQIDMEGVVRSICELEGKVNYLKCSIEKPLNNTEA